MLFFIAVTINVFFLLLIYLAFKCYHHCWGHQALDNEQVVLLAYTITTSLFRAIVCSIVIADEVGLFIKYVMLCPIVLGCQAYIDASFAMRVICLRATVS